MSDIAILFNNSLLDYGDLTTVNGFTTLADGTPIRASWTKAQPSRVQLFLDVKEWNQPAYEVLLPANVISDCSLKENVTLIWRKRAWKFAVRQWYAAGDNDSDSFVDVLVVQVAR